MNMLKPGITHEETCFVSEEMLASRMQSGDIDVFATPAMAALMEKTAKNLLLHYIEEGKTSVGTQLNISHVSASPLGAQVRAVASVESIQKDGRLVCFKIAAYDQHGLIGEGTHERAVIDKERFLQRLSEKTKK